MQNIPQNRYKVNPTPCPTPERDLQCALFDSISYRIPGPLMRYLETHPNRAEIAAEYLRVCAGTNTMPRRRWMRELAVIVEEQAHV